MKHPWFHQSFWSLHILRKGDVCKCTPRWDESKYSVTGAARCLALNFTSEVSLLQGRHPAAKGLSSACCSCTAFTVWVMISAMPAMSLSSFSKQTCALALQKLYQKDWNEAKQKGYDLRADAIEIKHAKASREIASEVTSFCSGIFSPVNQWTVSVALLPFFDPCKLLSLVLYIVYRWQWNMKQLLNFGVKMSEPIQCRHIPKSFWHSPQYKWWAFCTTLQAEITFLSNSLC